MSGVSVGLGVFDGVHLGHMEILNRVVDHAQQHELESAVITFSPHPDLVLAPERAPKLLMDLDTRVGLIKQAGIEKVYVQPFTREFASMEPEAFVKDVLVTRLNAKVVVVGFNFVFGKGGRGNTRLLASICQEFGIILDIVPSVCVNGQVVGSTRIRNMLSLGDVSSARTMLGRGFALKGTVVKGYGRGRLLGFPTANIAVPDAVLLPKDGVYAVWAFYRGQAYPGVCNIGSNPTFGVGAKSVEVHIFGFSDMLYGEVLQVEFVEYLREESRFQSAEELKIQIQGDIDKAKELLRLEHSRAVIDGVAE